MTYSENPTPSYIPPTYPVKHDSSLAIASLICGILSWIIIPFFGAIAAVITGHLAKKEIRESSGQLSGDGMATAGLILGYIQLGLFVLGILIVIVAGFALARITGSYLIGPSAFLMNLI